MRQNSLDRNKTDLEGIDTQNKNKQTKAQTKTNNNNKKEKNNKTQ